MRLKTENRSGRFVAVDWQNCSWSPQIIVQISGPPCSRTVAAGGASVPASRLATKPLPAPPLVLHTPRRNSIYLKTMKTILPSSRRQRAGFTLIELLVVISIIAVLAALLLPAVNLVKIKALKTKAKLEENGIVQAVEGYDSAYGRFPVSAAAQNAAGTGDFTYGAVFKTSGSTTSLLNGTYAMSNSEVIAILMDYTNYPNGSGSTINTNHQKNPQQTKFLTATPTSDPTLPGVGPDLVYRDPWGNPYVITMDLNYDDMCKDAFYSSSTVSKQSGNTGYNGLVDPDGTTDNFQYHGKVMVWSAGQDGKIDPSDPATDWENRNNVLSWQ